MKIIIVNYRFYISGGPEKYMFKFMDLAKSKGHNVIPFSSKSKYNIYSKYNDYFVSSTEGYDSKGFNDIRKNPWRITRIIWRSFYNFEAKRKLGKLVKLEKPDLIFILIPGYLSSSIYDVAKKYRVKTITRISDFRYICGNNILLRDGKVCELCIYGNNSNCIKNKCVKKSYFPSLIRATSLAIYRRFQSKKVNNIMIPSIFTKAIYQKSNVFKQGNLVVNPTFIETSTYVPTNAYENIVLCVGRFSEEKGFIYVVEALRYLKDIPIKIVITGLKSQANAEILDLLKDEDIYEKVVFTGFIDENEVNKLYKRAMCVCVPSIWYENMPNVILESYANGVPVIGSKIGSIEEIVENDITGLLFEPKNSKNIATCIRRLHLNPEYRNQLGRNARDKCEKDFSPDKHWEVFIEMCKGLGINESED